MSNAFERTIVTIGAHPDDTEIFVAGTLKLLRDRGWNVTVCSVTAGGLGGFGMTEDETTEVRKKEAEAAAALLDAEYVCLGGRDGYLYDTEELRIAALDLIRRKRAGVVISHLPMDYHSDHRTTCAIVDAAAMLATLPNAPSDEAPLESTPLFYHSAPLGLTDPLGEQITRPHFYVDTGAVEDFKMEMLACHRSQLEVMRRMHKMDDFFSAMQEQDRYWGREAGCEFAEAFWQHRGGGFQKDPLLQEELAEHVRTPPQPSEVL